MNTLATKISNSEARWKVAERFKRVSYGPWLFIYEGLRERMLVTHRIMTRVWLSVHPTKIR